MRKSLFSLALAGTLLAVPLGAARAGDAAPTLTVWADGQVEAAPDMASVRVGVQQQAESAAEAMDAASGAMQAMLEALAEAGLEPRDLQTSGLRLSPVYDNRSGDGPPRQLGFEAANTLTVRVRDLDQLGGILDVLVREAGANTLAGLRFGVADPAPLMDEARREAVAEARHRAEVLASAAGLKLGPIRSITAGGGGAMPMYDAPMVEAAAMRSVPVAAGEMQISADVTIVWDLLPAE